MRNYLAVFGLVALVGIGIVSNAKADEVDELIDLFQFRDDMQNQYDACIESSKKVVEESFSNSIKEDFEGIPLDSEDLSILNTIYSDFWSYGCDYWKSEEIINFYKVEFQTRFTPEEIQELTKFYETSLGKKLSNQSMEINQRFREMTSGRDYAVAQEAQKQWEEQVEKFFEHLEKKAIEGSTEDGS